MFLRRGAPASLVALVLVVLLGLVVGLGCDCGTPGHPDGGNEAGPDTSVDSGRDTGRDTGVDTGPDGQPDTGRDAAVEAARWVPLPGLPEGCVIERAENPAALFEPTWDSCGEGCEYLVGDARYTRAFSSQVGWHDGTRGWFSVIQGDDGRRQVLLAATEGPPVAAWRGPDSRDSGLCAIGASAIGDGAAAVGIELGWNGWPREWRLLHGPLAEIGAMTDPIATLDESILVGAGGVQRLAVSSTTVAAEVQPHGIVMVFEGGEERTLGGFGSAVPGGPQRVRVVGRTVWWEEWLHPTSLAVGSIDRSAEYFLRNLPGDAFVSEWDGTQTVWLQGYGWEGSGRYERIEMWTAPYTETAADLRPRLVRELPSWGDAKAGGGVYGFRRSNSDGSRRRIELYDIVDGRRRTFDGPAPDGVITHPPLIVSANELLVLGNYHTQRTIFRVQLASLPYDVE